MLLKQKIKIFYKPFVCVFVLSFLLINWSKIDWDRVLLFSNYKFIFAQVHKAFVISDSKNFIEIPKLNIKAPIVFAQSLTEKGMEEMLKQGVLHYPDSDLPGEQGRAVILGHSSPELWPDINYDRVFNDLNKLKPGDEILVNFNKKQFVYTVKNQFVLLPAQEIPQTKHIIFEPILILLSCWPPGNVGQRIGIQSILKQ